jgi:Ca2+-binding EF-hand superfamily protein
LLHTFTDYDTNGDGTLTQEEMFTILEEDLPNKQAIADALDMLKSLYEAYDKNQDGLTWDEFKAMALIRKNAFTDV